MLAVTEGLNSKTAEYLAKNNGQTDPESRDTSTNNSPFGSPFYHLSKNAQMIQEVLLPQDSTGGNKYSQTKSDEQINALFQRILDTPTESDRSNVNDFATTTSEPDTEGQKQ